MTDTKVSLIQTMAKGYNIEPQAFERALRATVVPDKCSNEQFAAFLVVAHKYALNPLTKEIFCFPKQGGGIIPVVSIDGWISMIQNHPDMDGMEFDDHLDAEGELTAITCRIYRKNRSRPVSVTEYMVECVKPTDVWRKWPRRMLRHKATIQAARYAFGFSGVYDQDEAERMEEATILAVEVKTIVPPPPEEEAVEIVTEPPPRDEEMEIINPEAILKDVDAQLGRKHRKRVS